MGWWKISESMVNGDGPADIMTTAVEKISKEYQDAFGRKPYRKELETVLSFCILPENISTPDPDEVTTQNGEIDWKSMCFKDLRQFTERN